ncbi:MAG: NYN domain-containing protein [Alphaproteobacteria bacterium]|nr:NYN domain-containing protein [Alphaproteobacteria bacterium]MDA8004119.1 NYN domain-containing protein [Alphaproteobacteria bacterium]MDA8005690.1 NYN domain-containing protein [Alphaproteobacteria bacterium]MDA8013422.1 NYN domain-containing protein [Alphaproteobacteria bacterium]
MPGRARFYIDGFNLYRRCLKDTPYRWLDCHALCRNMLADIRGEYSLAGVKYFTADLRKSMFKRLPYYEEKSGGKRARQSRYLRALETLETLEKENGEFEIIRGRFETNARTMLALDEENKIKGPVRVEHTTEKRSDVNLAAHLVYDACKNRFNLAVVISGDSDLQEAVRLAVRECQKTVMIFDPSCRADGSRCGKEQALLEYAPNRHKRAYPVRETYLEASQFPARVRDGEKFIAMPDGWNDWQGDRAREERMGMAAECLNGKCYKRRRT